MADLLCLMRGAKSSWLISSGFKGLGISAIVLDCLVNLFTQTEGSRAIKDFTEWDYKFGADPETGSRQRHHMKSAEGVTSSLKKLRR